MELFLAILLFAFSATVTPGPNNIMIMSSGLNHGVRKSLPHFWGICLGFPVMVIVIGFGLGVVFELVPVLHTVIKVAGILYLLYLAWLIANSAPTALDGKRSKPFTFIQAALFQWVNPKAWIMATGAVSTYSSVGSDINQITLMVSLAFLIVALPCVGLWMCFGVWLKGVLKSAAHQRVFNISMALLLVISILPAIYDMLIG
ncbi:MAG: LysE family translocator [Candidatus Pelagadaptatus aseana]|uniref:LysE family translocator n=1 Tax=Candidatus Pelagadaptatus aseana TaxID=3120508 RepID=UPI0039B144E1